MKRGERVNKNLIHGLNRTAHDLTIEDITEKSLLTEALIILKEYRRWSNATYRSYLNDIRTFEEFIYEINEEPAIGSAKLHHIDKWIKQQSEESVAVATIRRRVAALSSLYEFYKDLGIIQSNPFKAIQLPIGAMGHHPPVMSLDQLKQVYHYLQVLKREGTDIEVTVKVMMFTGLRNEALTKLKVKDVLVDRELIHYDAGIVNSKHKVQFFPIPSELFSLLKQHIIDHNLDPEDTLLHGLKGQALQNKQLNRITDRICKGLGWEGEEKITPHGFRATIASLLDERNMSHDAIKYLLGHSEKDNIKFYLRRDQRKINQLRKELTFIEKELEDSVSDHLPLPRVHETFNQSHDSNEERRREEQNTLSLNEELLMSLLDTQPQLALRIIEKGFGKINANSST
jgi:integrase